METQNVSETKNVPGRRILTINGRQVGGDADTLFLVEEGQANQGDLGVALEMIRSAAEAGADAIEFQFAVADDFYVRSHPKHEAYRKREFTTTERRELRDVAHDSGILISAAPLSSRLVPELVQAQYDFLTINSSDLTNHRILDSVATCGLPFFLSTLMASLDEIEWAVDRLEAAGAEKFGLFHGQHVMKTHEGKGVRLGDVSLNTIRFLEDRFGVPVGFTDHTSSEFIPALAASAGAAAVTKHLAPGDGWRGPDWQICLTPPQMAEARRLVRIADEARGSATKVVSRDERTDRLQMRRSIVATRALPEGTALSADHLAFKRPGTGIDPRLWEDVVGTMLTRDVEADEQLSWEHLQRRPDAD